MLMYYVGILCERPRDKIEVVEIAYMASNAKPVGKDSVAPYQSNTAARVCPLNLRSLEY